MKEKNQKETQNVSVLAGKIIDKIRDKEAEIGVPISYSVGKGSRELIILGQPLQQEATEECVGKQREVRRTRYIVISNNGVGAIDFVGQAKFDDKDNPEGQVIEAFVFAEEPGHKYSADGEWVNMIYDKATDVNFLRNLRGLDGVDKLTPMAGSGANVDITIHNNNGLGNFEGKPAILIGVDFKAKIKHDVTDKEVVEAYNLSVEKSKGPELKVDANSQVAVMQSVLDQMQ